MKRRTASCVVGIIVTAGLFACSFAFLPRERLLMREARRITSLNNGFLSPYLWLSDHSILLLPYHPDGNHFEFVQFDTNTGVQQPLDSLSHKYRAELKASTFVFSGTVHSGVVTAPTVFHIPPACWLSPDHKWILLQNSIPVHPRTFIAVALEGEQEIRWRTGEARTSALWLHDSQRWLEPVYTGRSLTSVILRDIRNPNQSKRLRIIHSLPDHGLPGITCEERLLQMDVVDHGLSMDTAEAADRAIMFPGIPTHKYSIHLPAFSYLSDVRLSCKGDRLAWMLRYDEVPSLSAWMQRLFPSYQLAQKQYLGLWVSARDGTGMKEIGHKSVLPDDQALQEVHDLQWLPGDREISFIYKDALYTVSTP